MTTPWPAELKWPFWGRGVERVEDEEGNQQVKGTAVMEEEAHQAIEGILQDSVRKKSYLETLLKHIEWGEDFWTWMVYVRNCDEVHLFLFRA